MWGTVLAIALIAALDPMRLAIAFLLISQPRPMRTLMAYWLGAMTAAVVSAAALLTVFSHVAPMLADHLAVVTKSSAVGYIQITIGILALPLAVLVGKGIFPRQRSVEMAGGPTALLDRPNTPAVITRLSTWADSGREDKRFWLAFTAGLVSATPPLEYLVVIVAILGSGAALGTQFSAAVIFIVVALLAIEIPLIGCLATPARSAALMEQLHNWMRIKMRSILAVVFTIGGFLLMVAGINAV